jgi:hypothetical protein
VTIGYEADLTDESNAWIRLHYQVSGKPVDYRVRLVTTKPNYGGRRWWFICPLLRGPPHRVGKLYLPPSARYFGSREAYELTYTSCQERGKYNGALASLRAERELDDGNAHWRASGASAGLGKRPQQPSQAGDRQIGWDADC